MRGFGDLYKSKKQIHKKTKPSKKQIIDQAFQFHQKGNILEAAKYYQLFIDRGFCDERIFSNYGNILRDLGKLKEAEICHRKAIAVNPDFANAHLNLGNILGDLGKLKEAEISYSKAVKINPDFAVAYTNLGIILRDLGKLKEAEICHRKAIAVNPDFANAHLNLGNILGDLGKLKEGFDSYLKVLEINPTFSKIYPSITRFLKESDLSNLNKSKLKQILTIILKRNDVSHKKLFKAFKFVYGNEILNKCEALDSDFCKTESILNDKLVINALKKIIFTDLKWEVLLSKTRSQICHLISKNQGNISHSALNFIIGLGEQCFMNEYVYSVTKQEKIYLNIIINSCIGGELNERNVAILSCYFPLYKLLDQIPLLKSFTSSNPSFKELIELQIIEPRKEIELSKRIKTLGKINNVISLKVKTQYEENPYPRWRYGDYSENQKISLIQGINDDITPNYVSRSLDEKQIKVLIAGCGTGNQILQTQRYKNAQITAIDLSLSSIAFAQRKINELEIDNVELIQMDILEVELLQEKFDIIECGGVLHHMDDPSAGLKALLSVLKNNCFLKLGLYSESARKDIVKARNYIKNKKLKSNEDNIRNFRQTIISNKLSELNSIKESLDFFTLSSCRDLCFHSQEYRFTIKQLQDMLNSNKLEFLGFLLPRQIKSQYKKYFPKDKKQTNLQNWSSFEEKNPYTFGSMYQFWVSKKKN